MPQEVITKGHPTRYWHALEDGRVQCDLCPRCCQMREGQRGLCFVRGVADGAVILTSYGRSSGFVIDPIEKKPLNHFYPGSSVLSFGTAGCNLSCNFCQNWDLSKAREMDRMQAVATPAMIAQAAVQNGCKSVAYTYNDPVIFLEYAVDVARACREQGVRSVAVTAGYMEEEARRDLFTEMDAANVDLKSFSEAFYHHHCGGQLQTVLDTLRYIKQETEVWLEITTLLIPGENDSDEELQAMCRWIVQHLGVEVPLHFTAFHPAYRMRGVEATPMDTLQRARVIAQRAGLHYVYTGNVDDKAGGSTYCHHCGERLIGRTWYQLSDWQLDEQGCCRICGSRCAGHFAAVPGDWGARRLPLNMAHYQ